MSDDLNTRLALSTESRRQGVSADGRNSNSQMSDPMGRGVTQGWLAQAFNLDLATVKKRLRDCPVKSVSARGTKMTLRLYDLRTAAAYLVSPQFSTRDYMRALKKGDLPATLQQSVWDALLKRQKWEENAGQLWPTDKVREVLREAFQGIKFTIQLWTSQIEDQTEVTNEQREILMQLADGLQAQIFDAMVRQADATATLSQLAELEQHTGEIEEVASMLQSIGTEDDEWDSEIGEMV